MLELTKEKRLKLMFVISFNCRLLTDIMIIINNPIHHQMKKVHNQTATCI